LPKESNSPVVMVTALEIETQAVLRQLGNWHVEIVDGTAFFVGNCCGRKVAVGEAGPGNTSAAAVVTRAITHFEPDVAFFVGIGRLCG
jgi:nucleoside phosphorylase